jgi:hypothetical protein
MLKRMTLRCRSLGVLAALGLVIAGCGESAPPPDQLALKRPHKSAPEARAPVTAAERDVLSRWADELRHGDVRAASKHFRVPSQIVNLQPDVLELNSTRRVEAFNESLPCGAKLIKVTRTISKLVVGEFELTDRPGGDCGASAGSRATFAFLIDADDHITRLIYIGDGGDDAPSPEAVLA